MVDFDAEGRVRSREKPNQSDLRYSWCTAVWTPCLQFIRILAAISYGQAAVGYRDRQVAEVMLRIW